MKSHALPLIGFLLLGSFYIAFCGISELLEMSGDASGYLLAAQALSPFQPMTPMLEAYSRDIIYPPLFPLLIGALGGTAAAASAVVIASALGAFACLFWWLREEAIGDVTALATACWLALLPITYVTTLNIWTENTSLFWTLLAIAAITHAERSGQDPARGWWLAAFAVAMAMLTRVASAPLLAAFGLYLLMKRPRRFIAMGAAAALPFLAWAMLAKSKQVGLSGYTSQWTAWYSNDGLALLAETARYWAFALKSAWRDAYVGDVGGTPLPWIAGAIGVIGVLGWLDRLWQRRFDAIYVLGYAAMLFAWPHPEEAARYGYVLLPFMVAYPVLLLQRLRARPALSRVVPSPHAFLVVAIALVVPSMVVNIQRFNLPVADELRAGRTMDGWYSDNGLRSEYMTRFHLSVFRHLKAVGPLVPEGDCIFSAKPQVVALHTRRIATAVPVSNLSDREFDERIARCRYAYVINLGFNLRPPMYPLERLGARARVVSSATMDYGYGEHVVGALIEILPETPGKTLAR